jgi:acyl-CoA thioester hydrolase
MTDRSPLRPRSHYRAWRTLPTRWMDNDAYGHVNNVVFYSWFDTAVNAWLLEQGLLEIGKGDRIGLVVQTGCRYARPVAFPQEVQAGISVPHIGSSSVHYHVGLFVGGNPMAAAEGFFVHVYVDRHDQRPRPLCDHWRQTLQTIVA